MLDLQVLSCAITPEAPTGRDLRQDNSASSLYYQIKDARMQARLLERNATANDTAQCIVSAWQPVYHLAQTLLAEQSKDLEVCAWLMEAALRIEGFKGLAQACELSAQLVNLYWDQLYPSIEEGVEDKTAALAGLNGFEAEGTLIVPLYAVPITQGQSRGPYALWQYQQALDIERMPESRAKQKRIDEGSARLSDIKIARNETPASFYQQLSQDLQAARVAFTVLHQALAQHCAQAAPPSARIEHALAQCAELVHGLQADAPFKLQPIAAPQASPLAEPPQPAATLMISRDQALALLDEIAVFFTHSEPHSPLPYLLQRAVRWGKLPLPELLKELIPDDNARGSVFKLTGIEVDKK